MSLSIAITGSGGAGALTAGNLLLEALAQAGCYGTLTRSVGPQIRGGEAAALLRVTGEPRAGVSDRFDILVGLDWNNVDRFAAELTLDENSLIIADPAQGEVPAVLTQSGATVELLPLSELAGQVKGGRVNMAGLGAVAQLIELPQEILDEALRARLASKGAAGQQSSLEVVVLARAAASTLAPRPFPAAGTGPACRPWIITGNEALGLGALRAGVRFVAAYPITPATEILEWLATALPGAGGVLVQAEDELASINMLIGASFGGTPALTATSGPGLALMLESIGLAVSSEIPLVVVDVMRGGPSTGIPTKSEQSDLDIAVYGLHGDAPHLVLAPTSVGDCIFTAQWAVYLAEALQVPAIVLSDQFLGQARAVIDAPAQVDCVARRRVASAPGPDYERYAVTADGVSPMALPGTAGGAYTADGLEHSPGGTPSSRTQDHDEQLDKRARKLAAFDYGEHWAELMGAGELAVLTWGSTTGTVREALLQLEREGHCPVRMVAPRLLSPVSGQRMARALEGVRRVLVIEQCHSPQFYRYLRAHYDLPAATLAYHRPGPLLFRPGEIYEHIKQWSQS